MVDAGVSLSRNYRALLRPNYLMGADRELVLFASLATVTLIFGPTGSGKSTLLALIATQFRRSDIRLRQIPVAGAAKLGRPR